MTWFDDLKTSTIHKIFFAGIARACKRQKMSYEIMKVKNKTMYLKIFINDTTKVYKIPVIEVDEDEIYDDNLVVTQNSYKDTH